MTTPRSEPAEPLDEEAARWLDESIEGLRRDRPDMSAAVVLTGRQRIGLVAFLVALATLAALWLRPTAICALAALNIGYAAAVGYRIRIANRRFHAVDESSPGVFHITDAEARATPDEELPMYSVLLPAYREPDIIDQLSLGVGSIDYPRDRLDVQLLLEADDSTTIAAAESSEIASFARIVLVPAAEPRTKPKACNYGLQGATGTFVTIYDAEDRPDPLQLRRAVVAFSRAGSDVACLQARLAYHNASQNLLTRWFAIEYDVWFGYLLPGLAATGAPLPLGGTSNHIRADVLRQVRGWDPFNVTEDADLGIRLARYGYRSAVLDSETYEEANSDVVNWARQRSRWNKGYLQSALIHLRHPARLYRELGLAGTLAFLLIVLGTPMLSLLNPVAWLMTLYWWMGNPSFIGAIFPGWLTYFSLVNLMVGNFATVYVDMLALRDLKRPGLITACLVLPLYWILMAVGTAKAFVQLITAPSYWEKTMHGLAEPDTHT